MRTNNVCEVGGDFLFWGEVGRLWEVEPLRLLGIEDKMWVVSSDGSVVLVAGPVAVEQSDLIDILLHEVFGKRAVEEGELRRPFYF